MGRMIKNKRLFGRMVEEVGNPTDENLPKKVFRKASKIQREEGKPRKQSIAIAASMNRRGEL